jgi:hypothetical protein
MKMCFLKRNHTRGLSRGWVYLGGTCISQDRGVDSTREAGGTAIDAGALLSSDPKVATCLLSIDNDGVPLTGKYLE